MSPIDAIAVMGFIALCARIIAKIHYWLNE